MDCFARNAGENRILIPAGFGASHGAFSVGRFKPLDAAVKMSEPTALDPAAESSAWSSGPWQQSMR
jgi:hypothetical protein